MIKYETRYYVARVHGHHNVEVTNYNLLKYNIIFAIVSMTEHHTTRAIAYETDPIRRLIAQAE